VRTKPTWVDLFLGLVLLAFAVNGLVASGWQGNWFGIIFSGLAILFLGGFVISALRQGLRPTTKLEKYEARTILIALGVAVGGLLLLLFLWQKMIFPATANAPQVVKIGLVLVPLGVWLAATLYTASRMRNRSESAEAYRRRVGFNDDEPQT
jgi:uncharacterized membrane protein